MFRTVECPCGTMFTYKVKRGRPRVYCAFCKEARVAGATRVTEQTVKSPIDYGNAQKRAFQSRCYEVAMKLLNQDTVPDGRVFASLCDDQTGENSQYEALFSSILTNPNQYLGFCDDEDKIRANEAFYPKSEWIYGDMCSRENVSLMNRSKVQIVDYDACKGLTNPRVVKDLGSLLRRSSAPIIMVNVWIKGRGKDLSSEVEYNLSQIFGSWRWKTVWWDDYESPRRGRPTYRTLMLEKVR